MCGIAGIVTKDYISDLPFACRTMTNSLQHRGPDNSDTWHDSNRGIALGHRRLSIVDLSPAGHQPMHSSNKRFIITYNGEIYNHLTLRRLIEKDLTVNWKSNSDTETLLAGFELWGIKRTLEKATGMFAFAVFDTHKQTLMLARDRTGEKPLYYGWQNGTFLFSSELKALKAYPQFSASINRDAICLLLRYSYIPAPHSIYDNIYKLEPGKILTIDTNEPKSIAKLESYWSAHKTIQAARSVLFQGAPEQAADDLEILIQNSIRDQMIADVPLGAFLSGGIDSTTVTSLMQSLSSTPIKTFSIGFHEAEFNEAEYAKEIAHVLGTDHTELYVSANDALNIVPTLPDVYDEPFSDASQIPTILVAKLAKEHVTVSLSGDGGDELFCGYNRYQMTSKLWRKVSLLPLPLRKLISSILINTPEHSWDKVGQLLGMKNKYSHIGQKAHKGGQALASKSIIDLYRSLTSHIQDPSKFVINGNEPKTIIDNIQYDNLENLDEAELMMALDLVTYMPDDILTKVDRAAMSSSLETRVPFLDHRIIEFAWRLPLDIKMHNNQTKWPLRQILDKYVPRKLVERPKSGFAIPVNDWLRGPLKEWASSLLDSNRLRQEGFFHPALTNNLWHEHLSGSRNRGYQLWNILMFQAWLERQ